MPQAMIVSDIENAAADSYATPLLQLRSPAGLVHTVSGFVYTPCRVVYTAATLIPWRHPIYLRKRNEKNNG